MKRSDLITENSVIKNEIYSKCVHDKQLYGTKLVDITLDEENAGRTGLRKGRYTTVFTESGDLRRCLTELFREYLTGDSVLVAGLGNKNICSDSIGAKALRSVPATAHLAIHEDFGALGMKKVYVIEPGVTGKTGIGSGTIISNTARYTGAECVVVIDSLACSDVGRLCTTVQVTDTGISPGSGVGNDREAINSDTVGLPVVAVGVPTVIDLDSISGNTGHDKLMVTPRNIDILSDRLADTVGISLSLAIQKGLSEDEIRSLILL